MKDEELISMVKRIKIRNKKGAETQRQFVSAEQFNITREIEYIIGRAQEYDSRVVSLGYQVLFSTQSGDAWILDGEDHSALCLARSGERQVFNIVETAANFSIEWTANYQIEGENFIVIEQPGQIRTIVGYPVQEILQAVRRTQY